MFLQILKNSIHPLQVGLPKTKPKIFLMKHTRIQIFFLFCWFSYYLDKLQLKMKETKVWFALIL